MSTVPILRLLRAPIAVQVCRFALMFYGALLGFNLWHFRKVGAPEGLLAIGGLAGYSWLAFVYAFLRAPRSRWVVASANLGIPAALYIMMCWLVWSRPSGWWDWVFSALITAIFASLPVFLALCLFLDRRTSSFFTGNGG